MLYILLFSANVADGLPDRWVVWNVGQGQMVSHVSYDKCYHFDAGGEFIDKKKFHKMCGSKQNIFSYTHWDWDHINLTKILRKLTLRSCMLEPPNGKADIKKQRFLFLKKCPPNVDPIINVFTPKHYKNSNQASKVYYNSQIFIPGDSDKKSEKYWTMPTNQNVLVLAHHGSKMSTSERFIQKSKNFKMAISSARHKRYKHPHHSVKKLLTRYGISLIRTEIWGDIIFYTSTRPSR